MYKKYFSTYNMTKPHEYDSDRIKIKQEDILYNPLLIESIEESSEEPVEEVVEEAVKSKPKKRKFGLKKQYDHTISFEQLLKNIGADVRITSSFRPNGKTSKGTPSNHSKKDQWGYSMAYDIVPNDNDFEKLKNLFLNSDEAKNWFKQRGYGIINEIIPQVKNRTGASGNHFHVGPDLWAQKVWNSWLINPSMLATEYITV